MATIIAGGFGTEVQAQATVRQLLDAGVPLEDICTFRVNPPGEHHALPAGGDHAASPGAKHAHGGAVKGAAIGAAVGAAAGAAAIPIFGPAGFAAGVGVGAYTGSLVGSLKGIDDELQPDATDVRPAENLVAVNVGAGGRDAKTIAAIFRVCGAQQIERAEGRWANGVWADFDPTTAPHLIGGRDVGRADRLRAQHRR